MALAKQPVVITPKGADQRTDKTLLAPGKLLEAINVQQNVPGLYEKRNGYAKLTRAADEGTITEGVEEGADDGVVSHGRGLASTGRTLCLRGRDCVWLWSDVLGMWIKKVQQPIFATHPAPTVLPFGYKPSKLDTADGKLTWYFGADIGENDGDMPAKPRVGHANTLTDFGTVPTWWYYRVVDAHGTEVVPKTRLGDDDDIPVAGWQARAIEVGGYVWLFVGADDADDGEGRYIYSVRFNATVPEVPPEVVTFYDAGTDEDHAIAGFDIKKIPSGDVLVVVIGKALACDPSTTANGVAMLLDAADGVNQGKPQVGTGLVGLATEAEIDQLCVELMQDTADPSPAGFYVLTGHIAAPKVYRLNPTTYALAATIDLDDYDTVAGTSLVTGYHLGASDRFVTFHSKLTAPEISRFVHNATTGDQIEGGTLRVELSVCSRPFLIEDRWHLIGQYDDGSEHLQGRYTLIDATTGAIHGRSLYGLGGDLGQRSAFTLDGVNFAWTVPAWVDGDRVSIAVNSWDASQFVTREVSFVFDELLGPLITAKDNEETTIPGAWPLHVCGGIVPEYIPTFPQFVPTVAEASAGDGELAEGYYACQVVFALRDSAGNVHRSQASPVSVVHITTTDKSIEWEPIPVLEEVNDPDMFQVELYVSEGFATTEEAAVAPTYLQQALPNGTTDFTMAQSTIRTDELLYSFAGAELPNEPPPPFRASFVWRDRLILLDTDVESDVWVSKEKQPGFGFAFSSTLAFNLAEAGRIRCGGAIDYNLAAIMSDKGIWIISGPGPDSARGEGQYDPVKMPGNIGCIDPHSVETTPAGLSFRATDGRRWLIPRGGGALVDLNAGIDSFRSRTSGGTAFEPVTNQLREVLRAEAED